MLTHADVSEFLLRKLMQSSASPFVISNAVRGAWLSTGIHPLGGQIADYGRAASQADRAGDRRQIIPFGAVLAPSHDRPLSASATDSPLS
jgi:hypothetical protein